MMSRGNSKAAFCGGVVLGAAVATLATVGVLARWGSARRSLRYDDDNNNDNNNPSQKEEEQQQQHNQDRKSSSCTISNTRTTTTRPSHHRRRNTKKKKRIGILCGSGPEAGIDLFQKVLYFHRMKLGKERYVTDKDAPNIIILSVSEIGGPRTKNDLIHGTIDCQITWKSLKESIIELLPLVDCFCICCHQLHFFQANIQQLLLSLNEPLSKFVSMVDVTIEYFQQIEQEQEHTLAILGGPITTDLKGRSPYRALAEMMLPSTSNTTNIIHLWEEQRHQLLDIIKTVKQYGPTTTVQIQFDIFLQKLQSQQGVNSVILACTEFPLLSSSSKILSSQPVDHQQQESHATMTASPPLPQVKRIDPTELVALEMLSRTQKYDDDSDY